MADELDNNYIGVASLNISWFVALVLGLVEGLTEFLPISSTGHLIIASSLLKFTGPKAVALEIVIQGAAILAVCWEYRRLLSEQSRAVLTDANARRFFLNMFVGFLPIAILGLLFHDYIEKALFHPIPVAIALVIGGVIILLADRQAEQPRITQVEDVPIPVAVKLGLWQSVALIPGTSRAAATIIGGMFLGMSRKVATEYSFFLAIPTLLAATFYKGYQSAHLFRPEDVGPILFSSLVAFITALVAVRGLVRFVSSHNFGAFAWYRIVFGGVILLSHYFGWVNWHSA